MTRNPQPAQSSQPRDIEAIEMPFCPNCWHWHEYTHWHAGHRHYGYYGPYSPMYGRPVRTDEEIERDIRDALFWDSWVDSRRVKIEVEKGIVTLTGTVRTPIEKRAAEDDAWDVPGVIDVRNELVIAGQKKRRAARPSGSAA